MKCMDTTQSGTTKTLAILVLSSLVMTACGERPPEKKAATQVAAKVNGGEVSVHQINFVLQRMPNIPQAQIEAAKHQVLENLVDQELAVQQALEAKLERTPEVMQALETARREVLARAYLEQAANAKAKPGTEDIKRYYAEHPELFANRKIYRLEEVIFASTPENLASVKDQLAKGRTTAEIVTSLKAAGVELGGGVSVKSAEQLSLDLVPKLAAAKEGQSQVIENGPRAAIVTVLGAKSEPIDEAKATPVIESFLNNKQKAELAREAIKQLREKGKIEYVGEFAVTQPADKAAGSKDAAISKGVTGLK